MKTGIITAMKSVVTDMISPKKAEKAAAKMAKEGGAAKLETAQASLDAQGRAIVKPYVKPSMETAKVEEKNMRASSDRWDGGNESGRDGDRGDRYGSRGGDFWDDEF